VLEAWDPKHLQQKKCLKHGIQALATKKIQYPAVLQSLRSGLIAGTFHVVKKSALHWLTRKRQLLRDKFHPCHWMMLKPH
jgi:hypothetical protein